MALSTGTRLGPYEILALIGAGGMGEVYKARDTRLDRIVAIKVSKEEFSERFEREARNVAALNHPNICTLHDIGPNYLVMEFVEGEMLSGPVPIDTALNFARQIAEAIEAAHEKGIVHRDLKPANIKVTPEGSIKVLDFGLAKALDTELPAAPAQDSPTLSMAMTRAGMILGTAAYMSPEQAKGKPADRRADIWAFGVVLYEVLVGKQAFTGETAAETLASVLKEPISLDNLPKETPLALRNLLTRCLERDVRRRLQAIGEARIILEGPLNAPETPAPSPAREGGGKMRWIPWAISVVLFLAVVAGAVWHFQPSPPPVITRFPIILPEDQKFSTATNRLLVAISPDGTQMVYNANQRLYLRAMQDQEARVIPGIYLEGRPAANAVFSPDGRELAFSAESAIKRIPVSGGAPVTICTIDGFPIGMDWSKDGIVFARGRNILRVSPNGGTPQVIASGKDGEFVAAPQVLPGGDQLLFTVIPGAGIAITDVEKAQIVVQSLKSGVRKPVIEAGSYGRYLPTGHIVYGLHGNLYAVPFDLKRLEKTAGPAAIVEGVARSTASGAAQFGVSNTGSLIYIPGPASTGSFQDANVLALVDRKGNLEEQKMPLGSFGYPRVSKNGKTVAYQVDTGNQSAIWIYPLSSSIAPRQLTIMGSNRYPVWSGDERVAFQSDREGDLGIWWQRADGIGPAERLTKPEKGVSHIPDSWSRDGQTLSYTEIKSDSSSSIWTLSLRDKKPVLFAQLPSSRLSNSVLSPDDRWIAYQAVESTGGFQVDVQRYPPGDRYPLPKDGTEHHPLFSANGKELFYVRGAGLVAAVSISTQPGFTFSSPVSVPIGSFRTLPPNEVRDYDILPDGRLLGVVLPGQTRDGPGAQQIQVVLNWFEELKQRVPVR